MAKLEIENLRKQYTDKVVPVKDISLEVEDGEFLTLLGPSGCGKSTLLRLIAGLEQPTQGRVIIGGKTVNKIAPGDRNIAMVFQSYALYPHMSIRDNIATALKLRKMPSSQISDRTQAVADKLGLQELLDRKPSQLSGGQRQRVALARSLVREPDVFLLDEPLSNLDALLREQVRADLKQIFKDQQKPVVYVTHDQTEAMTLSTQVAVLYDGLLQQLDPPHRIYTHPANQFVAGFVGSPRMNLLELNCKNDAAILGNHSIKMPNFSQMPAQIVMGIRPEDIRLTLETDAQTIEGRVYLVEELGKEKLINVRVKGTDLTVRALLSAKQNWEDETVRLVLPNKSTHWFNYNGDRAQPLHERDRIII
ncbi:ABC transporter ATP-binding protein [Candidatus Gracilibacteria bacterium]|nr:ABC transporter ATP-binding protein [Candidatus Gracilibacteria bacterium]NJM89094.1 ABC transporter ATP-binding protein [Hydrococcus sp. RU_2_2]NJP17931.1 ABC transporter ATP-binding protein [Hydrococcus sp. CRU_1_1]NJQ98618.1 ABC transporter ATP-binding protein [Hydrococcus sp. CSU_1_8]